MKKIIIAKQEKCNMNIPKKPTPPPSRTLRETLLGGLVETTESKRRTQAWQDGKCNSCIYGYAGTNDNGYQPCSCTEEVRLNRAEREDWENNK